MNAFDTVKDIVRIGNTAGLSKDVIDLMEKKLALLLDENEVLAAKAARLEIENSQLRAQLNNPSPVMNEQMAVLRVLATADDYWKPADVAAKLGVDAVRVHSLLAKLSLENLVLQSLTGFNISTKGRASLIN